MAIFNRVFCPQCNSAYSIYKKDDRKKSIGCKKCSFDIEIKSSNKNYYIEYYVNKKRYREKVGASRVLAENALAKRKVEVAEGKFLDKKKTNNIKFEEFADEYIERHSKVNNKAWRKSDLNNIHILKQYFSQKLLSEITPFLVDKFKGDRSRHIIRDRMIKPATVNRNLQCLKSMFNKAIVWERYSGENPVKSVKLFKENNKRTRFLEKEEIVRLLSNCQSHLRPIVVVALNTGMRRGEILNLKWQHVDFKRNIIHLYNTKNGEKREIPINEPVSMLLTELGKYKYGEYVFAHKSGIPYTNVTKSFCTALNKSGIKDFKFHDLRHCFGSHLVMSGIDLNTVRELLGHKSISMTLRYSHLSPDAKKRAVDVLSKQIDTISTPEKETEGVLDSVVLNV
jgi:integrase